MWHEQSSKQIKSIINCDDLDNLQLIFPRDQIISLFERKFKNSNKKSRSLIPAINASAIAVDTWWLIASITGVGILGIAALPVTAVMISIGILIGGYYFYESYQKKLIKENKMIKKFQLDSIKLKAIEELIRREKILLKNFDNTSSDLDYDTFTNTPAVKCNKTASMKKSIIIGATSAMTLSVSYILGVSCLFEMLGFLTIASALTGPIGAGIALSALLVAVGIGIFIAYKHYQSEKTAQILASEKSALSNNICQKKIEYKSLTVMRKQCEFKEKILSEVDQSKKHSASNFNPTLFANKQIKIADNNPSISTLHYKP